MVGDVVVVGSAINDNDRVEMPSGVVRGYDARTGALVWAWDPVPRDPADPARATWQNGADRTGAANVWGPISADPAHDLVFLPTTSPSPDYYGGERKGDGPQRRLRWSRCAPPPAKWFGPSRRCITICGITTCRRRRRSSRWSAAASALRRWLSRARWATCSSWIATPDNPCFRWRRRPVPQGGVPGEWLSPTQPFPVATPRLVPDRLEPQDAWGLTPWDRGQCRETIAGLRRGGIFTPPSLEGTLQYPGNAGGTNWGGLSFDRSRGLIVVNQTNMPFIAQLIPRAQVTGRRSHSGGMEGAWEYAPMKGTPYVMRRKALLSPWGLPCSPPPWGTLAAVEANTGKIRWQVPLGTVRELAPVPLPIAWGTPTLGGPLTTAGGLTFIGATMDSTFRAFDTETGRELWHAGVPASAIATPMTYRARAGGRQYVVVAAGGHGKIDGVKLGDYVVAFALP